MARRIATMPAAVSALLVSIIFVGDFAGVFVGVFGGGGPAWAQTDPDDQAPPAEEGRARVTQDRAPAGVPPGDRAAGVPPGDRAAGVPPAHGEPGHVHGTEPAGAAPVTGTAPAAGVGPVHGAPAAQGAHGAATPGAAALNDGSATAAAFFWLFALMTVGGSVFVISRRNLISAVMGMVGTFFAIAAVFTMLYAHFLAAIQVLVYAGAIMVLFVFVIMILNKPEDDPWGRVGRLGNFVAVGLVAYLLWRMSLVLWNVPVSPDMVLPPPDVMISYGTVEEAVGFGTTQAIGDSLFHEYLFPFEAVSLVLLIAVIGALAVARPHEKTPGPTSTTTSATSTLGSSGSSSGA
jgi:NADH-quinone oxidoreductase subunit J